MRRTPWIVLLVSVPVSLGVGYVLRSRQEVVATASPKVDRVIPPHLLHADCVKEMNVPGDSTADPILVAGCDDTERTAFIRKGISATVSVTVDGFPSNSDRLTHSGGTGVIIGDDGTILTAYHVIEDAAFVSVGIRELSSDGQSVREIRKVPVDVVAVSKEKDSALLRPKRKVPMPAPMHVRHLRPAKGELVWHFGMTTTWSSGTVSDPSTTSIGISPVVQTLIRGNQGDSGGPFVSAKGDLVGTMLSVSDDKKTSYFMPIAESLQALGYDTDANLCRP